MEKYVKYHHRENGVHEYVWLSSYRETIDKYIPMLRQMNDNAKSGDTLLVLHDFSRTIAPPFNLLRARGSDTRIRDDVMYKVAYISNPVNRYVIKSFIATGRFEADRCFFDIGERDLAVNWLQGKIEQAFVS